MEPDAVEPAAHRRPGSRDRVWVHAVWEVILAAAVVGAVFAVRRESSAALSGDLLRDLLVLLAAGVLLGSAFALSLRAAVPNLAVGAVAVLAGVLTAWLRNQHGYELRVAALITLGAAVALGIAMAIVVVGFRLPAWAVGLGAALALYAVALSMSAGRPLLLDGGPDLRRWAWPLAGGAVVVSLLGGALGLAPRTRAWLGGYRPVADAAAGRGGRAALTAATALIGSSVLAAGAGLILVLRLRAVVPDNGLTLLALAAAAAFLGGTSAYGRRGGLFGTVLAAGFLQLAALWLGLREEQPWTRPALLGGAIVLGLLVGRMVEAAGSTTPPEEFGDEDDAGPDTQLWDPYSTGSFTPGTDPYPTGGFTPAASYRPDAEPFWPGQAPAPGQEPGRDPEPARDLGPYRQPGQSLGAFGEPGRDQDR
jgi:ribose/xylose/arabinose/galactoside ABC-type transport system permease subunit